MASQRFPVLPKPALEDQMLLRNERYHYDWFGGSVDSAFGSGAAKCAKASLAGSRLLAPSGSQCIQPMVLALTTMPAQQ
jgi:hypothetical protein